MKKILVIGGTGFIGFHLLKKALKKKLKAYSFSRKKPNERRFLKKVKYLFGDISKKKSQLILNKYNFDYIVNLSGNVDHSKKNSVYKSHYIGCKTIAELFSNKKIKSFVQAGSCAEYGKIKSPQDEKMPCKPISYYGKAKLLATKHLINLYKKKAFPVTIIRLYQVYGPNQETNRIIPFAIKSAKKNKIFLCSSGLQKRDFTYIDEIIDAIFKIFNSTNCRGKIINLGSGEPISIKKVIKKIVDKCNGGKPLFGKIKLRKDESQLIYPNLKLVKSLIKWKANIKIDAGLNKICRE